MSKNIAGLSSVFVRKFKEKELEIYFRKHMPCSDCRYHNVFYRKHRCISRKNIGDGSLPVINK